MIAAGQLRDRILIVPSATTQDRANQTVESFNPADGVAVWAAVRQQSNAEQVRNGINGKESTYAIRIRYRYRNEIVANSSRILYRGRTLDVFSVTEGGYREWLDIVAKERAA